jgi:predicted nucleic acid-binding protein
MELRRWRVFMDTSALIGGLVGPTGAAREVLRLGEAGVIELILSRQVLAEADRTLSAKLPSLLDDDHVLLQQLDPTVVEDPDVSRVREATRVIDAKDAPILAAARAAHVDSLVTWNTRHFQTNAARSWVAFPIFTPGEFLRAFRESLEGL